MTIEIYWSPDLQVYIYMPNVKHRSLSRTLITNLRPWAPITNLRPRVDRRFYPHAETKKVPHEE